MFLFKITKLRWYCMMRKLNQNQWTEQVSQFKGSSSHQMRTNPFSAGNHYNKDLGPLWRSWRSWRSCRLWWWGLYHCPGGFQPGKMKKCQKDHEDPAIKWWWWYWYWKAFHCPGGFQPGKMKAEERWRPAGQKKEPQVRQNYLDSIFLSFLLEIWTSR